MSAASERLHHYPGVESDKRGAGFFTSNCSNGCGCWMGGSRSGGPDGVDPFGQCPNAPLPLPEPELGEGGAPNDVTGESPAEEPMPAAAWLIRWVPDIPRSEEVTTNPGRFVDVMENCARHGVTGERLYTGTTLGAARYDERRKRDREWCAAIIATQESRDGRMVCDVESLLRRFNLGRPQEPTP